MNTSIRLTPELDALLNEAVLKTGKKRSEIIREALETFCLSLAQQSEVSLYQKLKDSHWRPIRSGRSDLSTNKELLRKRMRERAALDNS